MELVYLEHKVVEENSFRIAFWASVCDPSILVCLSLSASVLVRVFLYLVSLSVSASFPPQSLCLPVSCPPHSLCQSISCSPQYLCVSFPVLFLSFSVCLLVSLSLTVFHPLFACVPLCLCCCLSLFLALFSIYHCLSVSLTSFFRCLFILSLDPNLFRFPSLFRFGLCIFQAIVLAVLLPKFCINSTSLNFLSYCSRSLTSESCAEIRRWGKSLKKPEGML